jgi:hypothetical protein
MNNQIQNNLQMSTGNWAAAELLISEKFFDFAVSRAY